MDKEFKYIFNKSAKGFTILEVSIVMMLTGILVVIVYSGFLIVSRQYDLYHQSTDRLQETVFFEKCLENDFDISDYILYRKGDNGIQCCMKDDTVNYQFYRDMIIRTFNN